jgi:hypothetical protein
MGGKNSALKMATGRHFSMSGINSGHYYLPIYQILMISENIEFLRLLCPEFIPDIEQFLAVAAKIKHCPISSKFDMWVDNDVAILKMAIGRNVSLSGINSGHHNLPTYEMSLKSDNVEFVQYCGRLIVFAPFLIIKSPKQSLGDLLFLLRFLLFLFLLLLFLFLFFLSANHEL